MIGAFVLGLMVGATLALFLACAFSLRRSEPKGEAEPAPVAYPYYCTDLTCEWFGRGHNGNHAHERGVDR